MDRFLRYFNLFLFTILVLSIGFYFGKKYEFTYNDNGIINGVKKMTYQNKINNIIALIDNQYLEKVDKDSLVDGVINQMMSTLDPHSTYIDEKHSEESSREIIGEFEGVGMEYLKIRDTFVVTNIINGSPNKNSLKIGDKLLNLDGKSILNTEENKIRNIILNKDKSEFIAKVKRNNKVENIILKKGKINLSSIEAATFLDDKIGYIKLNLFSETTQKDFVYSLVNLKNRGMKTLILDLRDNPGGLMDVAFTIADEFISEGKNIFYTLDRNKTRTDYFATSKGNYESGKLYVLVNEKSASASELLSGALQDQDRAVIIGKRTFGKGLIQKEIKIDDGSLVRLTVAEYFTPTGRAIQKYYKKGHSEEYYNELIERFENENLTTKSERKALDSIVKTTPKGKKVFGGGGITPDIKINESSFFNNHTYTQLNLFVIDNFQKYKSAKLTHQNFNELINDDLVLNDFKNYLTKFKFIDYQENTKLLSTYIKAELIKKLFGEELYYKQLSKADETIQKAIELSNQSNKDINKAANTNPKKSLNQ